MAQGERLFQFFFLFFLNVACREESLVLADVSIHKLFGILTQAQQLSLERRKSKHCYISTMQIKLFFFFILYGSFSHIINLFGVL